MKLNEARVTNFRSVVDSGAIPIERGVTVLIGKNEQGKTNILRALQSFNQDRAYTPNDLPSHLRPTLDQRPPETISIIQLRMEPEPSDAELLQPIIPDLSEVAAIIATKRYNASYELSLLDKKGSQRPLEIAKPDISAEVTSLQGSAKTLQASLLQHCERSSEFSPNKDKITQITADFMSSDFSSPQGSRDVVKTFATAVRALPSQDAPIQQDIAAATKQMDAVVSKIDKLYGTDQRAVLWQAIPRFIFHSSLLDRIPNEVPIAEFLADPPGAARGMMNLCRAAGLSIQKIQDLAASPDTPHREAYEDHAKGTISGGLNEFWRQEEYQVHFRIEREKLSVSISDSTYSPRIPPSDRSEGFQWYLSFYSALLNEAGQTQSTILLLDNPGLELHVDGQRDIKALLEEKIATEAQVIYVTHSPALIDPFNLSQLRKIELLADKEGTKVSSSFTKSADALDLLEPVRSAIGASLVGSLILNDFNIIVEGASDKPILEGAFAVLRPEDARRVVVNGSMSETKDCFLALFYKRAKLPFVVLVDADSAGRDIADQLKSLQVPETSVLDLRSIFPQIKNDFAIEDLLSEDFYHRAVARSYPHEEIAKPDLAGRKRANVYEASFRETHAFAFSKKRVADGVKALLLADEADDPSRTALSKLTDALWERLQAQIAQPREPLQPSDATEETSPQA